MNALQLKSALQAARDIYVHTTLIDYTPFWMYTGKRHLEKTNKQTNYYLLLETEDSS